MHRGWSGDRRRGRVVERLTWVEEPREGAAGLPARRLTSDQLEAVIRRAVELQAGTGGAPEGVSEAEAVRIGRELGIPDGALRQALVEVRNSAGTERGALVRLIGPSDLAVARVVRMDAGRAARDLERYFVECERMTVQRRRPGWVVFERAGGIGAALGRATHGTPLLNRREVDVAVEEADHTSCYVRLRVSLEGERLGFLTGAVMGGGGAGGAVAVAASIAVAPPLALLGLPVMGAAWWAMKAGYGNMAERVQVRLESVLDRLESGELLPAGASWRDSIRMLKF